MDRLGGHLTASQGQHTTAPNFLSAGASLFLELDADAFLN